MEYGLGDYARFADPDQSGQPDEITYLQHPFPDTVEFDDLGFYQWGQQVGVRLHEHNPQFKAFYPSTHGSISANIVSPREIQPRVRMLQIAGHREIFASDTRFHPIGLAGNIYESMRLGALDLLTGQSLEAMPYDERAYKSFVNREARRIAFADHPIASTLEFLSRRKKRRILGKARVESKRHAAKRQLRSLFDQIVQSGLFGEVRGVERKEVTAT